MHALLKQGFGVQVPYPSSQEWMCADLGRAVLQIRDHAKNLDLARSNNASPAEEKQSRSAVRADPFPASVWHIMHEQCIRIML